MKFALVGYGRMGREIERVAASRGHRLAAIVDPHARGPRAHHPDAKALGKLARLNIQVIEHFHMIGDEADRRDDHCS